jgi:nicotinamidase-related amidase
LETLYLTGIDGKYCVNSTIKGALNRNYQIKIIKDLIVTKDKGELSKLKTEWLSLGVKEVELK